MYAQTLTAIARTCGDFAPNFLSDVVAMPSIVAKGGRPSDGIGSVLELELGG